MNELLEKLNTLKSFGIEISDDKIIHLEKSLTLYDDESPEFPEYWLIIRELGGEFIDSATTMHISNNISTIVYEDFIYNFPISYFLSQLKRISNGAFNFSIQNEFTASVNYFENPDAIKTLEFIIDNKIYKSDYIPYEYDHSALNPEWFLKILNDIQEPLNRSNINYQINEESITFLCISKENQNNLLYSNLDLGINLSQNLLH